MNRITAFLVATIAIAVGALIALGVGTALAQSDTTNDTQLIDQSQVMLNEQSLIAVAADTLGMAQADLQARLQDGTTTVAQIAGEQHVDILAIIDAFVSSQAERMSAQVAAGTLTQAEADARIAMMKSEVTIRLSQPSASFEPGNGMNTGVGHAADQIDHPNQ